MRKQLISVITLLFALPFIAFGQVGIQQLNQWKTGGQNYLQPINNAYGLLVPGLATSTTGCLSVGANGWITPSGGACGVAGGEANTGGNLGIGFPIYDSKSGVQLRFNSIAAGTGVNISTSSNNNTLVISSTGGSGGSGTVSTSTNETSGTLAYFTSNSATPALLGKVATTSLTANSPLSLSQAISVIGSAASALSLSTAGTWSGLAGTATALAANGTNCSAGSFALGVDASGNSEGCTVATTGTVTSVTGTWPIISSGGNTPAISWGGLSTSTAAVQGNIPYFSGVNTFANVATGTISVSGGITATAGQSIIGSGLTIGCTAADGSHTGCLSSTDWTTFNNKGSGTVTSVGLSTPLSSLSVGSTPVTTSGTITADLNLAHTNWWTALQNFTNASSSQLTATSSAYFATTGGSVGVGTTSPSKIFTVEGNQTGGVARIQRDFTSAPANSLVGTYDVLLNEPGATLGDRTGPAQTFGVSLAGGAENIYGDASAIRYGADTTGAFLIRPYSLGNPLIGTIFAPTGADGIGTSTPFATLSVHANNGDTNTTLFALASSTASATTTLFKVDNGGEIVGTDKTTTLTGVVSPLHNITLQTGTTTAWTASTTGAYIPTAVAPFAGTIQKASCHTDVGTLNVDVYHTSTHLALFNASTTVGTITFASNNTFTAGEVIYLAAGTPATAPTTLSCTLRVTETPY